MCLSVYALHCVVDKNKVCMPIYGVSMCVIDGRPVQEVVDEISLLLSLHIFAVFLVAMSYLNNMHTSLCNFTL